MCQDEGVERLITGASGGPPMSRTTRWILPLFLLGLIPTLSTPAAAQAPAQLTVEDLLGDWRWQKSMGGFVGDTILPTTDQWVQLKFLPEGKLHLRLPPPIGQLAGTYALSNAPSPEQTLRVEIPDFPPQIWPLPQFSQTFFIRSPEAGVLVLDEGCCDRYMHYLVVDASGFVPIETPSLTDIKTRWSGGSD